MSVLNILDRVNNGDYDEMDAGANLHPVERLLPGLTRGAQDKLIHDVSRDMYKEAINAKKGGGAYNGVYGGKRKYARDVIDAVKSSDELEKMMHNMPESMQDSYLMSMIDDNANLLKYYFDKPEDIAVNGKAAGGYYAPRGGEIHLPYDASPRIIIHETGHRTNHILNPINNDGYVAYFGPNQIMYGAHGNSSALDYMVDANLGASINKEIVEPVKQLSIEKADAHYANTKKYISSEKFVNDAIDELFPNEDYRTKANIRDMYDMSLNTTGFSNGVHDPKYVAEKYSRAHSMFESKGRKSRIGTDQEAAFNSALSSEGAAELGEEIASFGPRYTKNILNAPETTRRMMSLYHNDWRKKKLQEFRDKGNNPSFMERYGAVDDSDNPNDQFSDYVYNAYAPNERAYKKDRTKYSYKVRIPNPYGGYTYYRDIDNTPFGSPRYEYRNLDDGWSVFSDDNYKGASVKNDWNFGRVKFSKENNLPASEFMKDDFVIEDNTGRHIFDSISDAKKYLGSQIRKHRIVLQEPYIHKTFVKRDGKNIPTNDQFMQQVNFNPEVK